MMHRAFIIAGQAVLISTTLSCVALVALWIAGSFKRLQWEAVNAPDIFAIVGVVDGHMVLHWDYFPDPNEMIYDFEEPDARAHDLESKLIRLQIQLSKLVTRRRVLQSRGFYFSSLHPLPNSRLRDYVDRSGEVGFDLWLPALLTATVPTWCLIRFWRGPLRRKRRRRRGLCLECGYSLEGNVSGVCSECGEAR